MITTRTLKKHAPTVSAAILELIGSVPNGLAISLTNLDPDNTITYRIQTSPDGTTWTPYSFPTGPSSTASTFALLAGATHLLRVIPPASQIQLVCSGDADIEIGVTLPQANHADETLDTYVL